MNKTIQEFHKEYEDIYIFLQDNEEREGNGFLEDVWTSLVTKRKITVNQINGVRNSMLYVQKKKESEQLKEQLKEEHKDDTPKGNFVGKEKQRYNMTLKYVSGKRTSRGFYIHNFIDKEGNSLMTFASSRVTEFSPELILGEGDCFTCRATVNRHSINDFDPTNKIKQTVLNRIKYNKYLGNLRKQADEFLNEK